MLIVIIIYSCKTDISKYLTVAFQVKNPVSEAYLGFPYVYSLISQP